MLCAKGILACSKESNLSLQYEPTASGIAASNAKIWSQQNLAEVALNGCLMAKAKLRSPSRKMKSVKRASSTASTGTTLCGSMKSSLGCAGKSGPVAMSPWKREVVRRVRHCPVAVREENKENSVVSAACSSFAISRAESMSSVASNVSRIGRLGIRGQLRIDITPTSRGSLNIRVSEAKHLKHVGSEKPCFYTQVTLVPEDENISTYVTRIVSGHNPVFDETFSVAVGEKDKRRRVILSVMQMQAGRSAMIGCMSFGVRHLTNKSKEVSGWFYLLNDELGRRKHLRVVTSGNPVAPSMTSCSSAAPSAVDDAVSVISSIAPSDHTYHGSYPCEMPFQGHYSDRLQEERMLRVQESLDRPSDACAAHGYFNQPLRPIAEEDYDFVEMPRFGEDTMQYSGHQRNIEISTMATSGQSGTSRSARSPGPRNTPMRSISEFLSSSFYDSTGEFSWQPSRHDDDNESVRELHSVEEQCWNIVADLDPKDATKDTLMATFASAWDNTTMGESVISQSCRWQHLQRLFDLEDIYVQLMLQAAERFSRPLRHCILRTKEHATLFQNIEKLIVISQFHVRRLGEACARHQNQDTTLSVEAGIGAVYLPQLNLLCEAYQTYCAGVAKALVLLEDLKTDDDFSKFVTSPAPVSNKDLDIEDFIRKPALHMEELLHQFDSMMLDLPLTSQDFQDVKTVLESLQKCFKGVSMQSLRRSVDSGIDQGSTATRTISTTSTRKSTLTLSSQASVALMCRTISRGSLATRSSRTSMGGRTTSHVSLASRASSYASQSTMYSVDPDVADIQSRLVIPETVEEFQLSVPNRHVIFKSELYWVDGWKWVKVELTLMNDMILLTTCQDNKIVAIREPTPLRDIIGWDFDCMHPGEFVLTIDDLGATADEDNESCLPTSLVFRAHRVELKNTWHQLLNQRINACRSQREYNL